MPKRAICLVLACVAFYSGLAIGADVFNCPVTVKDIDIAECKSFHEKLPQPATIDEIVGVVWKGGVYWWAENKAAPPKAPSNELESFHYVVAFKQPVKIGSMLGAKGVYRCLKRDAPYPGDPNNETHWMTLDACANQSDLLLSTFPAGCETRAVLYTVRQRLGENSCIRRWNFFAQRYYNITPLARANASGEEKPPSNITDGSGYWVETGRTKEGLVLRSPVTDAYPSWFVLSWPEQQIMKGIYLDSNFEEYEIQSFTGALSLNPPTAPDADWETVVRSKNVNVKFTEGASTGLIPFDAQTRAIKIKVTRLQLPPNSLPGALPKISILKGLHVYTSMGEAPIPSVKKESPATPPYVIPYKLAGNGSFTLAVDTLDGLRVRNVVARADRKQGDNAEHWDLKDENGQFVAPGRYHWKAITAPPLELRYEMTPYPNIVDNSPANSPWLNGENGSGGWLADHGENLSCVTAGEHVYFGSITPEDGTGFIATDLNGKRLWGIPSFSSFGTVSQLAAEGSKIFESGRGETDVITMIDFETQKYEEFSKHAPSSERKTGIAGLAAHNGKLYASVNAKASVLENAYTWQDVDIEHCVPSYPNPRESRSEMDYVPDVRDYFLRLFRLKATPPGQMGLDHKPVGLIYLESTRGPQARQHILLSFKRLVALGSLVFPVPPPGKLSMTVSMLKSNAPYPPNPDDRSQWIPFESTGKPGWEVVPAPANALTRALKITFSQAGKADDELGDLANEPGSDDKDAKAWAGQLEGMKLLRRRFVNLAAKADVRINSGAVGPDGSWDAQRTRPISAEDPGIYGLEWKETQPVAGLAIKEVDGKEVEIDAYMGPAAGNIDFSVAANWQKVASYTQERRNFQSGCGYNYSYNALARYLDGYVDFGKEINTRAIRLRVVEQYASNNHDNNGVRMDQGGQTVDMARCRVYGVAALRYIGGEVPEDTLKCERIEVYDIKTKKLEQELAVKAPGKLAVSAADGGLYSISEKQIVRIDRAIGGKQTPFVTDLLQPAALSFDDSGQLYVADNAPERQNVRVYDTQGKFLRTIGTPGGHKVGPWDTSAMSEVADICIDKNSQLWVVEETMYPKRIAQFTTDGVFKREFLGNTRYGGGGVLDPWDKSRVFYGALEFALDWQTGKTRLKNLTWKGDTIAGEVPVRIEDRTYMVTNCGFYTGDAGTHIRADACGVVYLYEKDHLKRVAAMGVASGFPAFEIPELRAALGIKSADELQFIWTDKNGDGKVQSDEVTLSPRKITGLTSFNGDLSIVGGSKSGGPTVRWRVKEYLANGAPVFVEEPGPKVGRGGGFTYSTNDGRFFTAAGSLETAMNADGKCFWSYKAIPSLAHTWPAFVTTNPLPEHVLGEFCRVGHEMAHAGDLGEFMVVNSENGVWNIWTSDGLLAGQIFSDARLDKDAVPWSMTEHQRGMRFDKIHLPLEHFNGYFCRSFADNKYYVVAGHNHLSVIEVQGIDKFKRLGSELEVTQTDLDAAQEWQQEQERKNILARAPVLDCARVALPPGFGQEEKDEDWGPIRARMQRTVNGESFDEATLRIAFDSENLYVCCRAIGLGPLKNTGDVQSNRIYKTGACVDLQIGVDPTAAPDRRAAAQGDIRILLSRINNKPVVMLYESVVPGTPEDQRVVISTPASGTTTFDRVRVLPNIKVMSQDSEGEYMLKAAIPLKQLGLKIIPDLTLKFDWGMLCAGPDGNEVVRRLYWTNKTALTTSDEAAEARLHPDLWGTIRFQEKANEGGVEAAIDNLLDK